MENEGNFVLIWNNVCEEVFSLRELRNFSYNLFYIKCKK